MLARDESGFIQMAMLIHPVAWLDIPKLSSHTWGQTAEADADGPK